jgi:uncharacterized protein (DUF1778 family)
MPSLNLPFTDDELAALRKAAARKGVSLRTFAHDAVISASDDWVSRREELLTDIFEKSAELNERLA